MRALLPHRPDVKLEAVEVLEGHLVAFERVEGLQVTAVQMRHGVRCVRSLPPPLDVPSSPWECACDQRMGTPGLEGRCV